MHGTDFRGINALQVVAISDQDRVGVRIMETYKEVNITQVLAADIGAEQDGSA